ncbi:MAG: LemA family protein [Endomicrobium sp.]|jgi:LemA protein|nr:LemA family protein [Endomicrobium sp.]
MSAILSAAILITLLISVLILIAIAVFAVSIYNSLVTLNVNIDRASSNIEVLLKQRFDEIPRLVEICKGYMAHERETLEKVIKARDIFMNAPETASKIRANYRLGAALQPLFAVSERYPKLKANEEFIHLQKRVTALENEIADRREFYNASVAVFNSRIRQIPDIAIAGFLKYKEKSMFKSSDSAEYEKINFTL